MSHRDASAAHWRSRGRGRIRAPCLRIILRRSLSLYAAQRVSLVFATHSSCARWAAVRSDSFFSSAHRAPLIGSPMPLRAVPDLLASRHAAVLTLSSASAARETM